MRLYINDHYFISIIKEDNIYNCQVMELVHGMGMNSASIRDNQEDVISSIVFDGEKFKNTSCKTASLRDVLSFHENLLLQL